MDSIGMLLEASNLLPQSLAQPPQAGGKQPTSPAKPARRNSPVQLPEYLPEAPNDGDFGLNRLPECGNGYELLLAKKRTPDPESKDGNLLLSNSSIKNITSRVGRQRQPSQKVVEARNAKEAAKNAKNSSKRSPKSKTKVEGAQSPLAMGTAAAAEGAESGSGSASDLPAPAASDAASPKDSSGGSTSSSVTSTSSDDEEADDPAESAFEASEPSSEDSEFDASETSSDSEPRRRRRNSNRSQPAARAGAAAAPGGKGKVKAKSGKRSGGGGNGGGWSRLHNRNRVPEAQLKLIRHYEDQIRRAGELPESGEEDSSDDEPPRSATAKKVGPIVPMPLAAPTAPLELKRVQAFINDLTERLHKNPRELDGVVLRFDVPAPGPTAAAASGAGAGSFEQGGSGGGADVDGKESKFSRAQRKRKREAASASTSAAAGAEDHGDAMAKKGSRLRPRRTKKPRLAAPGEDQDGGKENSAPATSRSTKVRGKFDGKSSASAPGPLNLVMVAGSGASGRDTDSKSPFAGRTADEFMPPSPTPAASLRRAASAAPALGRSSRRARSSTGAGAGAGAGAGSGAASAGAKISAFGSLLRAASSPLPAEPAEEEHSPDAAPSSSSSASSSVLDLLAPRLPTPAQTPLHLQRPASPPRLIRHRGSGGLHLGVSLYLDLQPFGYGSHPSFPASPPTPFQQDLGHRAAAAAGGAGAGPGAGPAVGLRFSSSLRPWDLLLPGATASRGLTSPSPPASAWASAPGGMLHTADRGKRMLQCLSPPPPGPFRALVQQTAASTSAAGASPVAGVGFGAGSGVEERASPVFLFGPQQLQAHSAVQGILGTDLRSPSPGAGLPSLLPGFGSGRERASTPTFARGTNFVLKRD